MTAMKPIPNDVADLFHYDADTGVLRWKESRGRVAHGDVAGSPRNGYVGITIRYSMYAAHRIAWAIAYGDPGDMEIDHRDGNKSNNRLDNLRLATRSQNGCNLRTLPRNTSKTPGVSWHGASSKWRATIVLNRRQLHLGLFDRIEDAAAAHRAAADELHGEFAAHRREVAS